MNTYHRSTAFTLIEIIVTLGLSLIMFTVTWVISSGTVAKNETYSYGERILNDFRNAQFQSMFDAESNTSALPYGIHLESKRYVSFRGTTYTEGAIENRVTTLPSALEIRNITTGTNVLFALSSGEVASAGSFSLFNKATNSSTVFSLSSLGIIRASN